MNSLRRTPAHLRLFISKWLAALVLLPAPMVANAQLNNPAVVLDTTNNLTWVSDGNLMVTQASSYAGGPAAYVDAVIAASGGAVFDTINNAPYTLTAGDFDTSTGAMSWYGALAWINYLNATSYQGYEDWRLPEVLLNTMSSIGIPDGKSSADPPISSSELAELFYGLLGQVAGVDIQANHNGNYALFSNLQSTYWFGSELYSTPPRAWLFDTRLGTQGGKSLPASMPALAVRSTLVILSPGVLNFGTQPLGTTSAPLTVTIADVGPAAFPISNIAVYGGDFQQTNTCGTSTEVCTINVTFTPSAAGAQTGSLSITSGNTIYSVALTNAGTVPVVTMTPSSTSVTLGTPVTLTWTASAGTSCSASGGQAGDGWSGSLASSGSKSLTEPVFGTFVYKITCAAGSETTEAQATVVVLQPTATLPTATLLATPSSSPVNQTITLNWSSTNADGCSASGGSSGDGWAGSKAVSGTATITEASAGTMTYTITCTSGAQTTSASAQVTVTPVTATALPPAAPHSGGGGALDLLSLILLLGILGASGTLRVRKYHR